MFLTVISPVNNENISKRCLLASPDLRSGVDVILQSGFASAAAAYNSAMQRAKTDLLVFVHQDVYLPEGWVAALLKTIEALTEQDPNWGVLGVWGLRNRRNRPGYEGVGYLYYNKVLGNHFDGGLEVRTLDEVLLIVRKSSGLSFDESLPGFHMYGADICMEAERRGMKNYAISAFCIHNSHEYLMLPLQFWKAYFFMRRKWMSRLPIKTSSILITRYCWPVIKWILVHPTNIILGREKIHKLIPDPGLLYQALVHNRVVAPQISEQ